MKCFSIASFALASSLAAAQAEKDTVFIKANVTPYDSTVSYRIDTLLFDSPMMRHILVGTTVLTASPKNESARNFGYSLLALGASACQKELDGPAKDGSDRVISVLRNDTMWIIETNISSNCCHSFLGEIEVVDGSILNLIYHGYGTYCFCECCFGLTYRIGREIFVDPKDVNQFMINGDKRTLRRID
ncbi:MAG: hypothetical protein E6Q44_00530 [Flavobacteriales bacterium]|jgi:hypothetical protein|nr:MAG: hypothetical protein E6Q44_00530 [Flavobacteriales bacterium]